MQKKDFLKLLANAGPTVIFGFGLAMILMPQEWEYNSVNSLVGGSAAMVVGAALVHKQYKAQQKKLMDKLMGKNHNKQK